MLLEREAERRYPELSPEIRIVKCLDDPRLARLASVYEADFIDAGQAATEREDREFAKSLHRTNMSSYSIDAGIEKMARNLRESSPDPKPTLEQAKVRILERYPGLYAEYVNARESGA